MRFLSPSMRLLSAGIKFLFYIWLSSIGEMRVIANLSIINVMLGIFIFLIPLDYYVTVQKHYKYMSKKGVISIINHWLFLILSLLISLFVFLTFIYYGDYRDNSYYIVFVILFFEIINTEMNRILIIQSKINISSFFIFIRVALWPILTLFFYYIDNSISIFNILFMWMCCVIFVSLTSFIYYSRALRILSKLFKNRISFSLICRNAFSGSKNIISSISIRLQMSVDKYFILHAFGTINLAKYQVSLSLVSLLVMLTDTIIVPKQYSKFFERRINKLKLIINFYIYFVFVIFITLFIISGIYIVNDLGYSNIKIFNIHYMFPVLLSMVFFILSYPFMYLAIRDKQYISNSKASIYGLFFTLFSSLIVELFDCSLLLYLWLYSISFLITYIFRLYYENKNKMVL